MMSSPEKRFNPLDSEFWLLNSSGYTIIELLIYLGIAGMVMVAFTTMLIAAIRIQARQESAAEVNQQSQFLLQTVQRYVETSSFVDMATSTPTSTLKLRMPSSSIDNGMGLYIYLSSSSGNGVVYVGTSTTAGLPLTTNRVNVGSLTFTRYNHPGGHDSVSVSFFMTNNSASIAQRFVQNLRTSIGRVSAATFDSNLLPDGSGRSLGVSGNAWNTLYLLSSINNVLYFSGSRVGINTASPGQALEVNGALILNPAGGPPSQPNCTGGIRGAIWVNIFGGNTTDTVQVCLQKSINGPSVWATLNTTFPP